MELTLKDIRELIGGADGRTNPFEPWLGKDIYYATVTHHYTGRVTRLIGNDSAMLADAAWIADDGRLSDALRTGEFSEVEPLPGEVQVMAGGGLLIVGIPKLPKERK